MFHFFSAFTMTLFCSKCPGSSGLCTECLHFTELLHPLSPENVYVLSIKMLGKTFPAWESLANSISLDGWSRASSCEGRKRCVPFSTRPAVTEMNCSQCNVLCLYHNVVPRFCFLSFPKAKVQSCFYHTAKSLYPEVSLSFNQPEHVR